MMATPRLIENRPFRHCAGCFHCRAKLRCCSLWRGPRKTSAGATVIRHALIFVILFEACQLAPVAHATVDCDRLLKEPDYRPEDVKKPMRFFIPEKNACLGNAVNNPYLAVGMI